MTTINTNDYDRLLQEKKQRLQELFHPYTDLVPEIFASEKEHYRMRAEFRIWHEGDDLYFYMFDKETNERIRTDQFLPAGRLINQMMLVLIEKLKFNQVLRHKLFQVDFLSTLSGEILVSLLYHRKLDEQWIAEAHKLKDSLAENFKVDLVGRARKQKIMIDRDYVIEILPVGNRQLQYKQIENSFTQPNAHVAVKMLEWALDCTRDSSGDLLELYCGNGNFSLALAPHFRRVLATELAAPSVLAAQDNIAFNAITNVTIIRMSAEDFSNAMKGTREFNRLRGIDLKSFDCQTILVDPPRAGLDPLTIELVTQYNRILYISCNPVTLIENMATLSSTHTIKRFALFDQFPYTSHMECGILLEKKAKE